MTAACGVAFVGAGFISYSHHLAVRAQGARLVAMASHTRRTAEHRARIFGAEPYTFDRLEAMLARSDVDVVFVMSPNALHAAHANAAIAAGKHVVIEKPMALTIADAEGIEAAARRRGVGVGYAENQVFSPIAVRARELVAEGAVGRVRRVVGFCGHGGPPAGTWFWDPKWAGGGAQFDMGSHTVATALHLVGQPEVEAIERARLVEHPSGVDGRGEATLVAAGGVEIDVTSSFVEPSESMWYEVHGDSGVLRMVFSPAPFAQQLTLTLEDGASREIEVPRRAEVTRVSGFLGSMGYLDQAAHFLECFASGRTPRQSGADGVRVVRILLGIYLAAGRGRGVRLGEVPADRLPIELWKSPAS
jgi:predicted dehydrogenase